MLLSPAEHRAVPAPGRLSGQWHGPLPHPQCPWLPPPVLPSAVLLALKTPLCESLPSTPTVPTLISQTLAHPLSQPGFPRFLAIG